MPGCARPQNNLYWWARVPDFGLEQSTQEGLMTWQAQTNRLETPLKRCSFFWICRDEREFQSFKDVLVDILADTALANIFELNTCAAQLQSIRMIT